MLSSASRFFANILIVVWNFGFISFGDWSAPAFWSSFLSFLPALSKQILGDHMVSL